MEAFAEGAVFVVIAEFTQELAHLVGAATGAADQAQGGGEGDSAGVGVLEHAALEGAALLRAIRVEAAGPVLAEGGAGLGKTGDRCLAARNFDGQPERAQFLRVVAWLELDEVEQRAVAAESA